MMKKWKIVLFILLILTFLNSTVLAANDNSKVTISMDGKKYIVKKVPVVLDGQAVFSDIPTFIHPVKGYTLVPIRFIGERYGAEVTWNQKTKTVTVKQQNKKIQLTINSEHIYINGEKKSIKGDTKPKLVTFSNKDSRTMVPLRLVSEALGFEVGWDNGKKVPFINTKVHVDKEENRSSREITNILVEKGTTNTPKITVKGTEKLKYSTELLKNPYRLVINIEDSTLNIKDDMLFQNGVGKIEVNSKPIDKINISQFSSNPNVVRIVINLSENADFDIIPEEDGKSFTLSLVNKVGKIEKKAIEGKEALIIHNTGKPKIKSFKLSDPKRIVIDLLDSSLENGDFFAYDYNISFIKGVRVSQFVPDNLYKPNDRIVRLVLDINEWIQDPNVKIHTEDNKIIIIPETNLGEIINYSRQDNNNIITINAKSKTNYNVEYNKDKNTMIVSIPSDNIDIEEGFLNIKDGLVNDVTIKKLEGFTKVIITFRRSINYNVLSKDRDDKITLSFKRDGDIKLSDRIIVIDPGHGGQDPGAVRNNTREKDVNLSVSLKLNERLKDLGYTTIMTRDDDITVGLYDRAPIANNNQADLFISIHSNSMTNNSSISGIQVLYHSKDKANVKKEHTLELAKIMMDELVKGTGAQDKGLIPRERTVVIRDTEMPSVLIELGFLSNPVEAELLKDDSYQDILVKSIIKGIEKYFELY